MRGIKYRAWDKELKKMFYAETEQLDNGIAFLIKGHFDDDEPVWMQHTGLKDKNGKEIYEGDIVKAYDVYGDNICEGQIIWDEYESGFCIEDAEPTFIGFYYELEVLGNSYEKPELW